MPSRGFAVLLFLGLFAAVACGSDDDSSGSLGTAGAGRSGPPVSYPCAGPNTADGSAGQGGEAGQTGQGDQTRPAVSCVVGQSFCYVSAGKSVNPKGGTVYAPECRSFSDVTKCATNPTCDCFCSVYPCVDQCQCNEVDGFATVTCDQV
jgi:hypothetical protein